jgi:hypothetical protein
MGTADAMNPSDDLYVPDGEADDDDPDVVEGMEWLAALRAAEGDIPDGGFGK